MGIFGKSDVEKSIKKDDTEMNRRYLVSGQFNYGT